MSTTQEFFNTVAPVALEINQLTGGRMFPETLMVQFADETGFYAGGVWRGHDGWTGKFNLAGISPDTVAGHSELSEGSTGAEVGELQGLLAISKDNDFGPQTKQAVVDYQTKHGLVPDGIVGPKTWSALLGIPAGPHIADYASYDEFAQAYQHVIAQNAYGFPETLDATNPELQMVRLGRSQWAGSHYDAHKTGRPGIDLVTLYNDYRPEILAALSAAQAKTESTPAAQEPTAPQDGQRENPPTAPAQTPNAPPADSTDTPASPPQESEPSASTEPDPATDAPQVGGGGQPPKHATVTVPLELSIDITTDSNGKVLAAVLTGAHNPAQ